MKLDDKETSNAIALLARIGSSMQKSGPKPGAPTQLWVEKTKCYYSVFDLDIDSFYIYRTKKGPPPIGAFVLKVTRQR